MLWKCIAEYAWSILACGRQLAVAMHFPVLMIITQSSAYCLISGQPSFSSAPPLPLAIHKTLSKPHKKHKIHICNARTRIQCQRQLLYVCVRESDSVCAFVFVCVYSSCIFYLGYWTDMPRARVVQWMHQISCWFYGSAYVCVYMWLANANQFYLLVLAKTRQLFISIVDSAAQNYSNSCKFLFKFKGFSLVFSQEDYRLTKTVLQSDSFL